MSTDLKESGWLMSHDTIELLTWEGSTVEFTIVTPKMATEWLTHNTHNRNIRPRRVDAYATDMINGDWIWNGETIKFARDGTLLDGQQRLTAILLSDTELPCLVVRGLVNRSQETMDTNAARTMSDALALRGYGNTHTLASTLRRVKQWEQGLRIMVGGGSSTYTIPQLFVVLKEHPELERIVSKAQTIQKKIGMLSPTSISLCWWLFEQIEPEDTEFFFERLVSSEDHHKAEPIYELQEFLRHATTRANVSLSQDYLVAVTIKAWNAYRAGTKLQYLRFRMGGAHPEVYPDPR